jgi:hypothetical protein
MRIFSCPISAPPGIDIQQDYLNGGTGEPVTHGTVQDGIDKVYIMHKDGNCSNKKLNRYN